MKIEARNCKIIKKIDGEDVILEIGDGFLICPIEDSELLLPESEEKPVRKIRFG